MGLTELTKWSGRGAPHVLHTAQPRTLQRGQAPPETMGVQPVWSSKNRLRRTESPIAVGTWERRDV